MHKDQAEDIEGMINEEQIEEAVYAGKTVKLNKPMRGDVKKFKVYVNSGKKDAKGRIKAKKVKAQGHGFEDPGFKLPAILIRIGFPVTFATVIGKNIKAEAKIIGITPPAFNFKGK